MESITTDTPWAKSNKVVTLTGYTAIERNNKVAAYIRRGYRIVDKGKFHPNGNNANRIKFWAKVVLINEQS